MSSTLFKVLGGALLTFALVWALVLGWWQSNDYEPSKLDLGLYLAALPLALVGGYLLLRGFIDHLKAPAESPAPAAPSLRDDDPLAIASAKTAAAERAFTVGLVDCFVVTAGGASVEDTLAAIDAGKRPEPSSRLMDEGGFPVFAAEVPELDVDTIIGGISGEAGALGQLLHREEVMRSFALLQRVMEACRDRLLGIVEQAGKSASLRVVWIVPMAWKGLDMTALRTWLLGNLGAGLDDQQIDVSVIPAANEVDALRVLDEIVLRTNRDPDQRELTLLLGASSAVDEQTVAQWADAHRLFSAQHQERRIPGEGGVALLLAGQDMIERLELSDSIVVSRLSAASRDKPADAGGRVSGKLIDQLITGLLDITGVEHSVIKTAVLDVDHRPNNLTEALEGLGPHFEHLDPIKDCLAIGTAAGDLSPIGALIALACARGKVLATEAAALCISNQHAIDRGVLLAMPLPVPADIKPSST